MTTDDRNAVRTLPDGMRRVCFDLTIEEYEQLAAAADADTRTVELQLRHYIRQGLRGSAFGKKITDAFKGKPPASGTA